MDHHIFDITALFVTAHAWFKSFIDYQRALNTSSDKWIEASERLQRYSTELCAQQDALYPVLSNAETWINPPVRRVMLQMHKKHLAVQTEAQLKYHYRLWQLLTNLLRTEKSSTTPAPPKRSKGTKRSRV